MRDDRGDGGPPALRGALRPDDRPGRLELGAGTGATRTWPAACARSSPPPRYEVVETGGDRLPFDDHSFDTVAATLVLCTVADPAGVVREVARVLRPDGRLVLLEHIRDPRDGPLGRWQDRLRRPLGWFAGGCRPNRDTLATLAVAGFDVSGLRPAELPASPPIVRPAIRGSAAPPSG
jgi:SAM-dependent methyltransferase